MAPPAPPANRSFLRERLEFRGPEVGRSSLAVDCDSKSGTDLFHPRVTETAEPLDQETGRHALDRVEVDSGSARDRVFTGLQHDLAGQVADGRCARADQRAPKSRDRRVSGEDHDRSSTDV